MGDFKGFEDLSVSDLKKAINNLIWMYFPADLSLADAEMISLSVLNKTLEDLENRLKFLRD